MNKTTLQAPGGTERKWHLVDAANVPVGRLAAQVAPLLRGKHKPTFNYSSDEGDYVVIINAAKGVWTGNKKDELVYWHTGFPGGIRNISRGDLMEKNPVRAIEKAVWGMMPKGKLGRAMIKKLKVYEGTEHDHEAQNPQLLDISKKKK
jgi:large subunit ribosomal protein L13